MLVVPPGISYLARRIHCLALPPALVYLGTRVWLFVFVGPLPTCVKIPAYIFSVPIALACTVLYKDIRDMRQAALRGAVLAPRVKSRWLGGIDTLLSLTRSFGKGWIGSPFDKYCQEYGPTVNIRILFENRVFTTEPEHIKAILATQFKSFEKGPIVWDQLRALLGTGVFNSDGEIWKFHRSMTRPFFSKDRISHFDIFEKHIEDAISQVKTRLRKGYPVDFQDVVCRFTLDSATEFLFGKDVRSLSAGLVYPKNSPPYHDATSINHPANAFAQTFSKVQSTVTYRGRFGSFWRLAEFWSDRIEKEMDVCYKFIDPILSEALEKKKSLNEGKRLAEQPNTDRDVLEGETLLDHLVNYTEDPVVIRDEILNIMIAGRDTTATTLTFTIYRLSQHPEVLQRLRAEILDKVGKSRRPTYEDLREMKYLRAVINEILRLYPPVPFNVRTSSEATLWPGMNGGPPIYIPPHTRIPYSVFLMQRREDLWGPDAKAFDPDRFVDERTKYHTKNPFIFVPFNAGPRICLGQQFAYNEVSYFLVRFLQTFSSISLAEDVQTTPPAEWTEGSNSQEKVIIKHHLILYIHEGLWVRMEETAHDGTM
ncbi:cytochrome P450 [Scleroderma yunnanense]